MHGRHKNPVFNGKWSQVDGAEENIAHSVFLGMPKTC
jgi:hypothetical protein